jgi:hypothetical protein
MRSTSLAGAVGALSVSLFSFTGNVLAGPYAPATGQAGSTAISMDSPSIAAWATGHVDYVVGANAAAPFVDPTRAYGRAEGLPGEIVSLGDEGRITLTFGQPIADGPGFDFAVFENSFNDTFLELAFVEVSNGGSTFVRFANDSLTPNPIPFLGGSVDPTNIDGLAGKYRGGSGTPFDLASLGLSQVTHVRLVDIVGDGRDASRDASGDLIYDPHPTSGSAGFDLDGVGVINQVPEPAGVAAIALSAGVLLGRRRRRRAK